MTGLADNLIKAKQKLDLKLKRMCSKKHQLRKNGITSVLQSSHQAGTIDSIEKEFKCVIRLPPELQQDASQLLSDMDMLDSDFNKGISTTKVMFKFYQALFMLTGVMT